MKLLGVSASPSAGSVTLAALSTAVMRVRSAYRDVTAEIVDIRDHGMIFCDGRSSDLYEGDTRAVIDKVVTADALIIATPIFRGAYSGILKNLVDVLPNDAMQGKAVGLVATGDSNSHFLAVEHVLKPLVVSLGAHPTPWSVYLDGEQLAGGERIDQGNVDRLEQLADAVVGFSRTMPVRCWGEHKPNASRQALAGT